MGRGRGWGILASSKGKKIETLYLCRNIKAMNTLVIKPRSEEEQEFLTNLLKKLDVEVNVVEEPTPNYETKRAMEDVNNKKGTKVDNSEELFTKLGM